jgi:hypothetical protein
MRNYLNHIILTGTFIFAIIMIMVLHAALTTLTSRNLENSVQILSRQISTNVGVNDLASDDSSQQIKLLKFVEDYPALRIKFYNEKGQRIASTNNNLEIRNSQEFNVMDAIAKFFLPKNNFNLLDALNGKSYSEVIWSAYVNNQNKKYSFVKVISPVLFPNSQKIALIMEVDFDVTKDWRKYDNTRLFCFLLISIIFSIFFVVNKNRS